MAGGVGFMVEGSSVGDLFLLAGLFLGGSDDFSHVDMLRLPATTQSHELGEAK